MTRHPTCPACGTTLATGRDIARIFCSGCLVELTPRQRADLKKAQLRVGRNPTAAAQADLTELISALCGVITR